MIVSGIKTELVNVEISASNIYEAVIETILKNNPELKTCEFVSKSGQRMVFDSVDTHREEIVYRSDGPASEDEIYFDELKTKLRKLMEA